jgi:hypothetical protein
LHEKALAARSSWLHELAQHLIGVEYAKPSILRCFTRFNALREQAPLQAASMGTCHYGGDRFSFGQATAKQFRKSVQQNSIIRVKLHDMSLVSNQARIQSFSKNLTRQRATYKALALNH